MKDHHIYKEELADRTVLDVRTIERMMAEMTFKEQRRGAQRNLRTIIAYGVGMHLKPHTTMKLIELGGYKLREYSLAALLASLNWAVALQLGKK